MTRKTCSQYLEGYFTFDMLAVNGVKMGPLNSSLCWLDLALFSK
jgi:hypothetical protein